MGFKFSQRSLDNLVGVHPDLVRVVTEGLNIAPYDYGVVSGVRDIFEQGKLVDAGASQSKRSAHLVQAASGFGHAVDIYILVNGQSTIEHKYFRKVVQALFTTAIRLGVQIEVGALWRDFIDSPHIQLNPDYYGGDYA